VQQREERAQAQPLIPSLAAIIGGGIGSMMRQNIIRQIEGGGTPVRENGMVIGVMRNGVYTGRQREADRLAMQEANRGDGGSQAAQMGAAAPQPDQPAADEPAGPATVRRSALAQQIEAENRRRRAAGLRRLGARTLLSGDRFTADTLGAG
jgi:pyruvate/2-oxoglutarate dehydrogenase complex dihydrolipoamide acyltransferase (E2) component